MADDVAAVWERAHRWLRENAPDALAWLRPPVSADALARAEQILGVMLPEDVRRSYEIHDGQEEDVSLFAGLRLASLEEMITVWRWNVEFIAEQGEMEGLARGIPPDAVRSVWRSRGWIPILRDGGGNHVVVDLDPGPVGVRGQLVYAYVKHDDRPRIATSFTEFLDERIAEWESDVAVPEFGPYGFEGFALRHKWPGR